MCIKALLAFVHVAVPTGPIRLGQRRRKKKNAIPLDPKSLYSYNYMCETDETQCYGLLRSGHDLPRGASQSL
jgi:hypothetical protein